MELTTGLPSLDTVLQGVMPGDNIVWRVDSIEDYVPFVTPYCEAAVAQGRRLIYFRFAQHRELLPESFPCSRYVLHPEDGFEAFIAEIFSVIESAGHDGVYYVFDCLSELVVDWYSDRMLGNFFMLTCPYLFIYDTVTYFAVLRNYHSSHAISNIQTTAQVVLDVYRDVERIYLHPLKVFKRYTKTMYMMHEWVGDRFTPVTQSAEVADILRKVPQPWLDFTVSRQGLWARTFIAAQEALDAVRIGKRPLQETDYYSQRLLRMAVTREPNLLKLAERYLDLAELIALQKRMIGTGLIGGKSAGMLIARAILRSTSRQWREKLEEHDSFYVGSDVFYTYLVENDCWWGRRKQRSVETLLDGAAETREKMNTGVFARVIIEQFMEMLDYFGQSPIIVRSSSLLEDNYGNAFSGKYESIFCTNQGTPQQRLETFMMAVRRVYASTMSEEALLYRAHRGLLQHDEQMALLVQRVSGGVYGDLFYPQMAGVGYSFNPYIWNKEIDPHAGMIRLVFGLGTRAVDRSTMTTRGLLRSMRRLADRNRGRIRSKSIRSDASMFLI